MALRAVTIGAGFTLRLDDGIGSIEASARADLATLEADPTEVDPAAPSNVPDFGHDGRGRVFPCSEIGTG